MTEDPKNLDFWNKQWAGKEQPWSSHQKHGWLVKEGNLDKLLRGRPNQKVFFPLCGDVVDMKWLGDLGHTVVGADLGAGCFEGFFEKHNISFTKEKSDKCNGYLYKSSDGKYRMYCCDIFNFSSDLEGQFDAVFDSAGLVALHPDIRKQYADVMTSLMTPDTIHIVEGVKFDEKCWEGPPYGLVEEEVRVAYEPRCAVELLDKYIHEEKYEGEKDENGKSEQMIEIMNCSIFTITLKTNSGRTSVEDVKHIDHWKKLWTSGNHFWATPQKHAWLVKEGNLDKLLRGRPNQKVFFPLCGDAVDLKWMGDLGHTVVGVDVSESALEGFFKKQNIPYTKETSDKCDGFLYKSCDGIFRLYCCDFFKFNRDLEGQFDALLDSGGLVAIHPDLRKQYADIMRSLMTPDSVHIVEGVAFDPKSWEEPQCTVEQIDNYIYEEPEKEKTPEIILHCTIYTVTLKS